MQMAQITLRIDDELARQVKRHAQAAGRSVNGWIAAVLGAAVDPELAGSEAGRTRERLARAGLLATPAARDTRRRPDEGAVRRARRAAGTGTPLSELVARDRG